MVTVQVSDGSVVLTKQQAEGLLTALACEMGNLLKIDERNKRDQPDDEDADYRRGFRAGFLYGAEDGVNNAARWLVDAGLFPDLPYEQRREHLRQMGADFNARSAEWEANYAERKAAAAAQQAAD